MEQQQKTEHQKPKKERKLNKLILIVLGVVLVIVVGMRYMDTREEIEPEERTPVNVHTAEARISNIEVSTPLTGTITAEDQASVMALLQSEVTAVYVKEGDYVSKGATLFVQDTTQLRGSYDQAVVSLNLAYESLNSAQTNYERLKLLFDEGAVPLQQLEQAETAYNTALQQIEQAQSVVDTVASSLSNGVATAPISGYVTELNVIAGSFPLSTMVAATITDTRNLELTTNVSEYLIGRISEGGTVSIKVPSVSDEAFNGRVKTIAHAPGLGSLTYPVTISLSEAPSNVKAGMFAEVYIISDQRQSVLCVPSDAVIIKSGETRVAVLDGLLPRFVTVTSGLDNGEYVEIQEGLSEGDIVIVEGQHYIIEGEEVRIIDQEAGK